MLKKSFRLLKLFGKFFYSFITKDYLRKDSLLDELDEAFANVELRARPLSKEAVEYFETVAFTNINREGMEVDFIKDDHYANPDTRDLTKNWNFADGATTIQEGHLTTLGEKDE